jgi:hypothetical protein
VLKAEVDGTESGVQIVKKSNRDGWPWFRACAGEGE